MQRPGSAGMGPWVCGLCGRVRERALIVVRARPRNLDFSMAVEKPPKVISRSMGCILDRTRCEAVARRLEQRLEETKTGLPVQPHSSLAHSRTQPYQGPRVLGLAGNLPTAPMRPQLLGKARSQSCTP